MYTSPARSPAELAPCAAPGRLSSCSTFQEPPANLQRTGTDPEPPPTIVPSPFTANAVAKVPGSGGRTTLQLPGCHKLAALPCRPTTSWALALIPYPVAGPTASAQPSRMKPPVSGQRTACELEPGKSLPAASP